MKHFKPNKSQMKVIRKYWKELENHTALYYDGVNDIEKRMENDTGIAGVEFIHSVDGGYFGVGNSDKTMKLIHL